MLGMENYIEQTDKVNKTMNEILCSTAEEVIGKSSGERKGKICSQRNTVR